MTQNKLNEIIYRPADNPNIVVVLTVNYDYQQYLKGMPNPKILKEFLKFAYDLHQADEIYHELAPDLYTKWLKHRADNVPTDGPQKVNEQAPKVATVNDKTDEYTESFKYVIDSTVKIFDMDHYYPFGQADFIETVINTRNSLGIKNVALVYTNPITKTKTQLIRNSHNKNINHLVTTNINDKNKIIENRQLKTDNQADLLTALQSVIGKDINIDNLSLEPIVTDISNEPSDDEFNKAIVAILTVMLLIGVVCLGFLELISFIETLH